MKKESFLTKFFWWCSGAESEILRQLPTERQKYSLIGATVFQTALFSGIAGTYAFLSVFNNIFIGFSFGIMWGVLIFTLNKYIISINTRSTSFRKTVISFIPGILLSTIISLTISRPLSLILFKKEINYEYLRMARESIFSDTSVYGIQLVSIKQRIDSLESRLQAKNYELSRRENDYMNEFSGTRGSQIAGDGRIVAFKRMQYETAKREYEDFRGKCDSSIAILNVRASNIIKAQISDERQLTSTTSFISKLSVLAHLKKRDPTINLLDLFISLIILLISLIPILTQILVRKGPYNAVAEIRERMHLSGPITSRNELEHRSERIDAEIEGLKERFKDIDPKIVDKMLEQKLDQTNLSPLDFNFQFYFQQIVESFVDESAKSEKKAKEFFRLGIIISIMGIVSAIALLLFWLDYFKGNKFEMTQIFEVVSGTIVVMLIEFLGAWFLKQYKTLSSRSLHILKSKAVLDRLFLSYLAIGEFTTTNTREQYLTQFLMTLDKDLLFPLEPLNNRNTSFMHEAISSISNLTDAIRGTVKAK